MGTKGGKALAYVALQHVHIHAWQCYGHDSCILLEKVAKHSEASYTPRAASSELRTAARAAATGMLLRAIN